MSVNAAKIHRPPIHDILCLPAGREGVAAPFVKPFGGLLSQATHGGLQRVGLANRRPLRLFNPRRAPCLATTDPIGGVTGRLLAEHDPCLLPLLLLLESPLLLVHLPLGASAWHLRDLLLRHIGAKVQPELRAYEGGFFGCSERCPGPS